MAFTNTPSGEGALFAKHPSDHSARIESPASCPKPQSNKLGRSAQAAIVEENIPNVGQTGQPQNRKLWPFSVSRYRCATRGFQRDNPAV
jgi:hypothetical protein